MASPPSYTKPHTIEFVERIHGDPELGKWYLFKNTNLHIQIIGYLQNPYNNERDYFDFVTTGAHHKKYDKIVNYKQNGLYHFDDQTKEIYEIFGQKRSRSRSRSRSVDSSISTLSVNSNFGGRKRKLTRKRKIF